MAKKKMSYPKGKKAKKKIRKVMGEFETGELHSGSEKGPKVTSKDQAVAIALNSARKTSKKKK